MKKVLLVVLSFLALVALVSLGSHLLFPYVDGVPERRAARSTKREVFSAEELKGDIAYARELLATVHPAPVPAFPLGDADGALAMVAETLPESMSRNEFYRGFAAALSVAGDDHLFVEPPAISPEVRIFPAQVSILDGRIWVRRNFSGDQRLAAGTEILALNGVPAAGLVDEMVRLHAGTSRAQREIRLAEAFAETLYAAYGFSETFSVRTGENRGTVFDVEGTEDRPDEEPLFSYRWIDDQTVLFSYRSFSDPDGSYSTFLSDMFADLRENGARTLVIDLRENEGGNMFLGDELLAYFADRTFSQLPRSEFLVSREIRRNFLSYAPAFLRWLPLQYMHPLLRPLWAKPVGETSPMLFDAVEPRGEDERFTGAVYVLMGPRVMSSASLFVATVRSYGFGTLVGESAGGYATHYGNVMWLYLPNTGLKIMMASSVNFGNSKGPILPDYPVERTPESLGAGRDRILEALPEILSVNE